MNFEQIGHKFLKALVMMILQGLHCCNAEVTGFLTKYSEWDSSFTLCNPTVHISDLMNAAQCNSTPVQSSVKHQSSISHPVPSDGVQNGLQEVLFQTNY